MKLGLQIDRKRRFLWRWRHFSVSLEAFQHYLNRFWSPLGLQWYEMFMALWCTVLQFIIIVISYNDPKWDENIRVFDQMS